MKTETRRPSTPDQVAAIWGCSPNHVRNLINQGELQAFRLGKRLLRIPAEAVDEFEQRQIESMSEPPMVRAFSSELPNAVIITHAPERKRDK